MTDTMPAIEDDAAAAPRILAEVNPCLAYASFQNAVPVLKGLRIANPGDATLSGARLELTAAPPFIRARSWAIDRLDPGAEIALSDRRVELDAAYLAGLNEAERGTATFRLVLGETLLAEAQVPVRLLARDEWGGAGDMAQLLPAFVMPNDPATAKLLRAAAERLAAHGHDAALDGYQSGDPRRAYMLAAALYSAAAGVGLHYAEPPASFEARGQKVRRPATILGEGLATCLDTTLLLAAGLEAAGLNAVVVLVEGHAAAGVWLVKRTLGLAVEPDPVEIRKALAARELVLFETTGVTRRPPVPFEQACREGAALVAEEAPRRFVAAVDVARSRSGGIAPLASHEAAAPTDEVETSGVLPLPAMPDFGGMPAEPAEEKPTTPAGRIDRWQRKLLDLSLRNRLLNFGTRGGAVPFLCPDAAGMEDRLAAGHALRIVSIPEQNPLGERDPALFREARGEDIQRRFAEDALLRDELASTLNKDDLDARLTALYRQARSDLAEGGTNTLFVAVGFLRWRKKPGDERVYRAPLLLLPAKLERRSAASPFRLLHHEDEVRFNATLLQFLERDFDLKVPALAGELPSDEKGIDVTRVLDAMRRAVRDTPGFEVVDEAALGTFSFAKYLMWKDLTERTDALRQNRVVRHLIDDPDVPFADAVPFRAEREIDRAYAPADIVTPLPADSSQIVATMAAAEGKDFVIIGPPGTGKSQTIANMIAQCLASRRTVLFVAEKTAALDVVYRRLREHGLGSRCLELHSSKADRRHVLAQLRDAWERGGEPQAGDWVELNGRLKVKRDALNGYAEALHAEGLSGMTPYRALGLALRGEGRHAPSLAWPSKDAHDKAAFAELEDLAEALGRTFAAVGATPALRLVDASDWSSAWQDGLLAAAAEAGAAAETAAASSARFLRGLGLDAGDATRTDATRLAELAEALDGLDEEGAGLAFRSDFARLREAAGELGRLVSSFAAEEARLSARFDRAELRRVPVEDLDRRWREASATFWPFSWFKRRGVAKLLGTYAREGAPDPGADLPLIRALQQTAAAIEASPLAGTGRLFAGLETDAVRLSLQLERAAHLREAVARLGGTPERAEPAVAAIAAALGQPEHGALGEAAGEHRAAFRRFAEAERRFAEASGGSGLSQAGETFAEIRAVLADLAAGRSHLRDWTSWCAVRRRAGAMGLGALVADLEAGAVPPDATVPAFRLGYARWWLPLAIDADKRLRDFRRFQHEHAIDDFRKLDDLVRRAASARVHAAIAHDLPAPDAVARKSELGVLRHQMELKRPSRSIRELIGAMPESFSKLAPCVLMSPLSIAQYLPAAQALFDVVIFDEASQITTWDAVGAVARGRQTVIVGDPKQLPPTNFFGRNEAEEEGEAPEHERDLESILDEARASGLPVHGLRWHYRSRHESLIAFSNHHYYDNRLITFPSPVTEDRAVSLRHVPDAVYDRGKSRTNKAEARAIASDIAARLRGWLDLPAAKRPTLGVITFNSQQQGLIQDLLDDERREDPRLEWFFDDERLEPVFVKNLENVQGDERDVILFSITFGRDAAGKLAMDFGALNREGGERRLNVAVTRARHELVLFSSIKADAIDLSRTKAAGVRDLKTFLDYADRGAVALPAADAGSLGGAESPFEEAVAEALTARGWRIVPQVGVSGFRVDMGVRHPDHAGAFVAGVECDGATYHRSATARDRDKVREEVLRGLGWTILRVWSTDWWFDPVGAADRLHASLEALVAENRARASALEAPPPAEEQPAG